jgi:hypothetical protein
MPAYWSAHLLRAFTNPTVLYSLSASMRGFDLPASTPPPIFRRLHIKKTIPMMYP